MKKANGFSRYNDLVGIEYIIPEKKVVEKEVKSPEDVILDSIFSVDEFGFPRTSLAAMLSDKTSDDVRKYIQDAIMVAKEQKHVIDDEKIVSEFGKLDPEFIANVSRNRFESLSEYEARLSGYIESMNENAEREKRISNYKKFWDKISNGNSDK